MRRKMEKARYRPRLKRKARHEFLVLAAAAALPVAMACVFPYGGPRASCGARPGGAALCAFVELDASAAEAAVSRVRSVLSGKTSAERAPMADLTRPTFGETPLPQAADASGRLPPPPMAEFPAGFAPLPPSLAAPALSGAEEEPESPDPPPAFPREELLKIE